MFYKEIKNQVIVFRKCASRHITNSINCYIGANLLQVVIIAFISCHKQEHDLVIDWFTIT